MKYYGAFKAFHPFAALLLLAGPSISPTFANSVIAGGYVPEKRNFTVTPIRETGSSGPRGSRAVAIIEIDNNLPNYELMLDFSGADAGGCPVSEVRLEGESGILGRGLEEPSGRPLERGSIAGQFLWSPGNQETATIRYRIRVMVTCARPEESRPPMLVGMHSAY